MTVMKKILIIAGLLAAIISCSKVTIVEEADDLVGFDTFALRTASSKAGDSYIGGSKTATTNIPVDSKFGVFAYLHKGNSSTGTVGEWSSTVNENRSNLMLNYWVQRQEPTPGTYTYYYPRSEWRYWPKNTTDRISFFAYYPYAANAFEVGEDAESDGTGITLQDPEDDHYGYAHNPVGFPKFKFVVNTDASRQVDFMISDMCLNQSKKADYLTGEGDVKFTFHHMLSQIRIKKIDFVLDNDAVQIDSVQFKFLGVPVSGICTPSIISSPDGRGNAAMAFNWSGFNSNNSEFTTTFYDESGTDAEKRAAVMLMIPHQFDVDDPNKDVVEVTFRVNREDYLGNGEYYTYKGHLRTSLSAGGLTGWERNKIYNYSITVTLNAIEFSVETEDWPEASTDVNTIKVDLENLDD